jgi:hypothetical protein
MRLQGTEFADSVAFSQFQTKAEDNLIFLLSGLSFLNIPVFT